MHAAHNTHSLARSSVPMSLGARVRWPCSCMCVHRKYKDQSAFITNSRTLYTLYDLRCCCAVYACAAVCACVGCLHTYTHTHTHPHTMPTSDVHAQTRSNLFRDCTYAGCRGTVLCYAEVYYSHGGARIIAPNSKRKRAALDGCAY